MDLRTRIRLALGLCGLALALASILLALSVPSLATPALELGIVGVAVAGIAYGMDLTESLARAARAKARVSRQ